MTEQQQAGPTCPHCARRPRINVEGADAGGHFDDGLLVVLAHGEVHEVLIEAAVVYFRRDGDGAFGVCGNFELIADDLRAAGGDGVVVGDDAVVPDLVEIVDLALDVDEAVGEAVGAGVEVAVRLDYAGVGEGLAGCVFSFEFDPALVHVALLGDVTVGDAFVLDDDGGGEDVAGGDGEVLSAERGDDFAVRFAVALFQAKDVYVEDSVAEEGDGFLHLDVVVVELRHDGLGSEPAVGG